MVGRYATGAGLRIAFAGALNIFQVLSEFLAKEIGQEAADEARGIWLDSEEHDALQRIENAMSRPSREPIVATQAA
jgi:hypothetical protein